MVFHKKIVTPSQLSAQIKRKLSLPKESDKEKEEEYDGDFTHHVSTGSTLLDLAISGGRIRGGGLPGGILVEVFGPSGSGKTVVLCQIAGEVQKQGGEILFNDPEARLNKRFATMFGLSVKSIDIKNPDTITEVFAPIRKWEPESNDVLNAVFVDSLAALSTKLEMTNPQGDTMGMRRAKEFSEELRKTCRIIKHKNILVVCSNQIRGSGDASPYAEKTIAAGGYAIGFYSTVRLRFSNVVKQKITRKIHSNDIDRIIGITTRVDVYKNSTWSSYRSAPLTIIFDYGIDNIRENLRYVKQMQGKTVYTLRDRQLSKSLENSIAIIEKEGLEKELEEQVIDIWEGIEAQFASNRKRRV